MPGEAGKGSTQRKVNKKKFDEEYERIFKKKKRKDNDRDR